MKPLTELKISKSNINQLADNLRALMKERDTSESGLAKHLNLPLMTIRRLTSGETVDPRISTLKLIADHFNVPIGYLIQDEHTPRMAMLLNQTQPHFIPILNWQTLASIDSMNHFNKTQWKNWHPISVSEQHSLSKNAFALPSKATMQPRFPLGTLFVVDPDEKPMDGDLVIIKIKNEISLRELTIDPPNKILKPIIQGSEPAPYIPSEHMIVGIIVLTMFYSRQNI